MVMEGVIVFPLIMFLLFSFISFLNYFFISSYIRQRVDAYGAYVCSVAGVVGDLGDEVVDGVGGSVVGDGSGENDDGLLVDSVVDDVLDLAAGWGSQTFIKNHLVKGGFLDEDRLVVASSFDGGYMSVRVEYGVDVVLLGRVVVVDFYERRLW